MILYEENEQTGPFIMLYVEDKKKKIQEREQKSLEEKEKLIEELRYKEMEEKAKKLEELGSGTDQNGIQEYSIVPFLMR